MKVRFPEVAIARPHYESVYCTLVHPTEPEALWIRTTVQKRPGKGPTGALWVTWFSQAGVLATKINDLPVSPGGHGLSCGPATQGPAGTRGSVESDQLSARWDLGFAPRTHSLEHLHSAVLYRAPLPRTKATSPVPDLDVEGTLVVNNKPVDLTGWTGMLGHNWGTEHAARWIWLRASGLGDDGTGWLDAVLGRVRVGPVLAPWTSFGALELDGTRHHLGGLLAQGHIRRLVRQRRHHRAQRFRSLGTHPGRRLTRGDCRLGVLRPRGPSPRGRQQLRCRHLARRRPRTVSGRLPPDSAWGPRDRRRPTRPRRPVTGLPGLTR